MSSPEDIANQEQALVLENSSHKNAEGFLDSELIAQCSVCKQWHALCLSEPKETDANIVKTWYEAKKNFWEKHKDHLENNGQKYAATITKALDNLETIIAANSSKYLDGCLLVVRVGSRQHPPAQTDIKKTYNLLNKMFKDVRGVRILVTTLSFDIQKIPLPQLINLQSAVMMSYEEQDENYNPALTGIDL